MMMAALSLFTPIQIPTAKAASDPAAPAEHALVREINAAVTRICDARRYSQRRGCTEFCVPVLGFVLA